MSVTKEGIRTSMANTHIFVLKPSSTKEVPGQGGERPDAGEGGERRSAAVANRDAPHRQQNAVQAEWGRTLSTEGGREEGRQEGEGTSDGSLTVSDRSPGR